MTADDISFEREDSPTPAQSTSGTMLLGGSEKSPVAVSPPPSEASVDILALTSDCEDEGGEVSMAETSGSEQSLEIYSSDEEEEEDNSSPEEDESYEESEAESEFSLDEEEVSSAEEDTPVKKSRRRTTTTATTANPSKPRKSSPAKPAASPKPPVTRQPLAELKESSTPDRSSQRSDLSDVIIKPASAQVPPSTAKKVKR